MIEHVEELAIRLAQLKIEIGTRMLGDAWERKASNEMRQIIDSELLSILNQALGSP